jgi:hypothetical protein
VPLEDNLRDRSPAEKRDEREELGFLRQPAVRWLRCRGPRLGTFGKFADKREIQREPQLGMDYSAAPGDVWVDYLSDTGDGWEATYTMAWLLAQESLDFDVQALPRGRILLLGGDQVYPTAEPVAYEDRFIGPFAAARPKSDAVDKPELYAIPGKHDWYDGLASFCACSARARDASASGARASGAATSRSSCPTTGGSGRSTSSSTPTSTTCSWTTSCSSQSSPATRSS